MRFNTSFSCSRDVHVIQTIHMCPGAEGQGDDVPGCADGGGWLRGDQVPPG